VPLDMVCHFILCATLHCAPFYIVCHFTCVLRDRIHTFCERPTRERPISNVVAAVVQAAMWATGVRVVYACELCVGICVGVGGCVRV